MVAKAILRYARVTPRKARRVVDLIRGRQAGEAMVALKFMPYGAARQIEKLLKSAMYNAEQKNASIDTESLRVGRAFVDVGPTMKRIEQRAMGRANVIRKRTCHITVELTER